MTQGIPLVSIFVGLAVLVAFAVFFVVSNNATRFRSYRTSVNGRVLIFRLPASIAVLHTGGVLMIPLGLGSIALITSSGSNQGDFGRSLVEISVSALLAIILILRSQIYNIIRFDLDRNIFDFTYGSLLFPKRIIGTLPADSGIYIRHRGSKEVYTVCVDLRQKTPVPPLLGRFGSLFEAEALAQTTADSLGISTIYRVSNQA